MRYITAPWRADYVRKARHVKGCFFCDALAGGGRRGAGTPDILFRGRHNIIVLNKFPYTPGHLMIAPVRHLADFTRARPSEAAEMSELLQVALKVLAAAYEPQGFNTGMNLGRSAGAGVADHYHLHVIPRWTGDSNFMPLVAETRVFIEDLETARRRLFPLFEKERRRRERTRR